MVGPQIRAARKARGWTQGELARRAGVGESTIGAIERGEAGGRNERAMRHLWEVLDLEREPPQEPAPRAWRWRGMQGKQ